MLKKFFNKHPVFTVEEFKNYYLNENDKSPRKAESALNYYRSKGRIKRLRRGTYAVNPYPELDNEYFPDPFLVASRLSEDAVLAHHTALEFHGRAYSVFNRLIFQTNHTIRDFAYKNWLFHGICVPKPLREAEKENFGVITSDYMGLKVKVTSLERTLVDILNIPRHSGSWEEIWRSLESIEFFDLNLVLEYVKLLGNATTAAGVGFFLQENREKLFVDDECLGVLKKQIPKKIHYLDGRHKNGKLAREWNLIVPKEILDKSWDELI